MSLIAPEPRAAYFRWRAYEDVRPAEARGAARGRCDKDAATTQDHDRAYTMHVRESLHTPFSLSASAARLELAATPTVILVHGLVVSGTYLEPTGAELAAYFHVRIPDLPGYGGSVRSVADPSEALSVREQVDVLVAWLRGEGLVGVPGRPPPFFLGNSMGNSLIADLAARYPDCIRGGVLQGVVQDETEVSIPRQLVDFVLNGRNEPLAQGRQVLRDYRVAGWRRVLATYRAMRRCRVSSWLRSSRCPLLLLPGELDNVSNLKLCEEILELREGIAATVLLDTPHTAVTTAPKVVGEVARRFFVQCMEREREAAGKMSAASEVEEKHAETHEAKRAAVDGKPSAKHVNLARVTPPRLTLDQSLTFSHGVAFAKEAAAMVLGPTLALTLVGSLLGLGSSMVGLALPLYATLLSLALSWRLLHRRTLLAHAARRQDQLSLWPVDLPPPHIPGVADFDSATSFLRAHSLALRGHDVPFLGRPPFPMDRAVSWLLNALPDRVRILAYAIIGAAEATPSPILTHTLDGDKVAEAVVRHYPLDQHYPAVALGSSSGALLHLYTAMGIPWLPGTLMFGVQRPSPSKARDRFPGLSKAEDAQVFDLKAELEWGREVGRKVLDRNPEWQLHNMADPNQDSLMVAWMSYFRLKQRVLVKAYREFLLRHLEPGGTILLSDCQLEWSAVKVGDRHYFQIGAYGGLQPDDYVKPSDRVDEFIRKEVLKQDPLTIQRAKEQGVRLHWNAPQPTTSVCEAEWGLPPSFRSDVVSFAREHGFKVVVLEHADPQDPAAAVAEVWRWWNEGERVQAMMADREHRPKDDRLEKDVQVVRLEGGSLACLSHPTSSHPPTRLSSPHQTLLLSQFVMVEPWWTMRCGAIPFWSVFSTQPCLEAMKKYLQRVKEEQAEEVGAAGDATADHPPFLQSSAALFPHGMRSVGFASVEDWLSVLRDTDVFQLPKQIASDKALPSGGSVLVGVREDLFPADFQTMLHFHEQVHLVTQQRFRMPSERKHFINIRQAVNKLTELEVAAKQSDHGNA